MNRRPFLSLSAAFALGQAVGCDAEVKPTAASGDTPTPSGSAPKPAGSTSGGPPAKDLVPPPEDVAAPPSDAQKTASGLAYKVQKAGGGGDKPTPDDKVKVHYTGWTADGKSFDSSRKRGQPATFGVTQVIKGWTEGLQLMTVGEQTRFWIPAELAYGDKPKRPGGPSGQLTFDVELIEIIKGIPAPTVPPDVAEAPKDATKTKSGLAYKVLTKGTGKDKPKANSKVKVHYSGWTKDGKMFDSSVTRGEPASFGLDGVIKGWTEGLQLMVVGEKTRFWIPPELAYGDKPASAGAPSGQLTFDVELLEVVEMPPPPETPKDLKAPPKDATKTASGLSYKVLTKGKGTTKPTANDRVKVHYSGWTTDGKMFDSSVTRGEPATFGLGQVIKGWTEGLQLMVEGEKTRFWIPAELAYGEKPQGGRPAGMLVFDVELLEIVKAAAR
jgi:peptidylprolyl isomerase